MVNQMERQIEVRCLNVHCGTVQRILTPDHSRAEAELLAGLLDGSSPWYATRPNAASQIGKCVLCGAPFRCTLFGFEAEAET
jgi:hypothetical protein